jgi:hypothetical protein
MGVSRGQSGRDSRDVLGPTFSHPPPPTPPAPTFPDSHQSLRRWGIDHRTPDKISGSIDIQERPVVVGPNPGEGTGCGGGGGASRDSYRVNLNGGFSGKVRVAKPHSDNDSVCGVGLSMWKVCVDAAWRGF